uniref:Ribonuclease H-like domain-containing protein n=2 Tax=Tanacetum cinerariifolium TaxID=118510 RepID=A0A6L2NC32_TANCI|nr:ribonuclease H-like domain-containing protein [Tanacetum cinerariifolium]
MVIYNALTRKEYERIFMCNMAKEIWKNLLITHQDSAFDRFNTIITSLKALDEGYSSKNYVRKFLRALHPKWRAKVTAIEDLKDLTSLSLDEFIGNLKAHEMIIKKDSEIVKAKVERKSIALMAKKESSDEECSTSSSEDEEIRDDKNDKSDRKCFRCGDPNHLIGECPKPPKGKNQKAFVGGSWSNSSEEDDEKVKDETCLVAHASSYSQNSKAYIVLNKHTKKVEESLNVKFDETTPPSKTSSLVDDDLDEEEAIKNMTIIGTKWVFRNKLDENGIVSRNKARVFERDVKGTTASSSNTQNVAFVSADNTSSTNDVITAYSVSSLSVSKSQKERSISYTDEVIHSFFANQSNAPQLDCDDLKQIYDDDLEEMDLKWQVTMISMRIKKFYKRTCRKLQFDTRDTIGFDKTKVEYFNCHKIGHFARDCRAKGNQESRRRDGGYNGNKARDNGRRPAYQDDSKALVTIDEEAIEWSGHVEEYTQNFAMMAYSSSNSGSDNETSADELDSKHVEYAFSDSDSSVKTTTSMSAPVDNVPKIVCEPKVWIDAPIIEEYELDSDDDSDDQHKALKDKGIVDSGCSRHMTGNKAHLADYLEFKGGSIAFGGSNGKIIGKGKIKAGRSDIRKEFKNSEIIEFCGLKGIKREYSNAETPQQNEVSERKNKTLIEAARTMLANSFLPTTFWAEAVNTAHYVFNKVLVTKPQNKTPYELLTVRKPIISYLRPFGCHVTILNTIDQLDKFDGKSDSRFLVGYSLNSNAIREELEKLKRQEKEDNDVVGKEATHDYPDANTNSTNLLNAVSVPVSAVFLSTALNDTEPSYTDDPLMPHFKDILASPSEGIFTNSSYDDEDFPFGKKAIGTKWVYMNKKDERGVVVRNNARLVTQGHRQEEGIDYEEESSICRTLKLDDEEGTSCLAKDEIFTSLANMGYEKISDKLTFYKAFFSPQWKFLIHTILQYLSAKTTSWNEFRSTMALAIICLATNQKLNFSRYILLSLVKNIEAGVPFYMFPRFVQLIVDHQLGDISHHYDIYDNPSLTKKVFSNIKRVGTCFSMVLTPLFENMLVPAAEEVGQAQDDVSIPNEPSTSKPHKKHKSKKQQPISPKVPSPEPSPEHQLPSPSNDPIPNAKDSLKLQELMDLCTRLSNKFRDLKSKVIDIKSSFTDKIEKLKDRVHKLEEENRILKEKSFKSTKIDIAAPDIDEEEPTEVEEVLEVVITAKLITEVVTSAEPTTTAAQVPKVSAPRKRRGMTYSEIRPLFEKHYNSNQAFLERVEEDVTIQEKEIEEEEATHLASKVLVVDYQIHHENNKPYYKIIRADGSHKLFLSFNTLLNNFDREDSETLWKLVKERFETTEPKNFSDDFLLNILKIKFEKPNIEANVRKDQKGKYRLDVYWAKAQVIPSPACERNQKYKYLPLHDGDTLSSCSNSKAQHMQQIQDKAKKSCIVSFRQLHSHLKRLSQNDLQGSRTESGFKRAFATLSGQDIKTSTGTRFLYVEQLEKQLDKEDFQETGSMAAFNVLETQFQMFITSRVYLNDEYVAMTRRVQLKREYDCWVNERQMQTIEEKVDTSKALDASSVDTESSRKKSKEHDTSNRSGNDAHVDVADIRPIYDEEPMAENAKQCHDTVGNKMHKAFPLPVLKFPLEEAVPTCVNTLKDPIINSFQQVVSELGKIPVLDTGKFEQWQFRIQQYLQHDHYALWEVIEFGDSKYKTAKELWAAILKTFGGNEATKKTKKNLLKQQYGNFKAEGSETLEQTFNRLQVIIGQLQFIDVEIKKDDLNQKFLTSLSAEWLMHTIVWRNRSDLDTMSLDDLYSHLKGSKAEEQAPKALMAIDGMEWDWSYMANDEEDPIINSFQQVTRSPLSLFISPNEKPSANVAYVGSELTDGVADGACGSEVTDSVKVDGCVPLAVADDVACGDSELMDSVKVDGVADVACVGGELTDSVKVDGVSNVACVGGELTNSVKVDGVIDVACVGGELTDSVKVDGVECEKIMHWHQVTPKECHLHALKRIFRYLKGHPKLGLWYPKELPFDLVSFLDSDYDGATQDRKSTTGGCQFLGRRLSMPCEALSREYSTSILRLLIPLVSKRLCNCESWLKDLLEFLTFEVLWCLTIDARLHTAKTFDLVWIWLGGDYVNVFLMGFDGIQWVEKGEHNTDFHPMVDFLEASPLRYALTVKPTVNVSHLCQFWSTARIETMEEGTKILATVDGIVRTVFESSLRRNLKLRDKERISSLPDAELFENLTLMGYNISSNQKVTIAKSSTLPHDSAPRVTSPAAVEGSMQHTIPELTALCTSLQRQLSTLTAKFQAQEVEINRLKERVKLLKEREGVAVTNYGDNAPIKGKSMDEGEAVAERVSNETEEMATMLTSMDVATILASGVVNVPTGSGSIPTASTPAEGSVPTGSEDVPTANPVFATATVVTPYKRRKGKEVMKRAEKIARDDKIARIHAEEELQSMIDGLDNNNETVAKYLEEYHQFSSELHMERRIELISDLVKYQDNYTKVYKFQSQQRKSWTKKQKRDYYMVVIRNNLGWKVKDFKGMTFEEVEAKFNSVCKQIEDFIPMGSKEEAERIKRKAKDKEIFMLVEKDYPLRKGLALVMICYKLQVENFSQMANDLVLKIYKIANSPRPQVLNEWQQSQFLKEKSNEAKVKHDIDVLETINIELEHNVAKLLKENETLKKNYKEFFDSIKITKAKTIEHTTSFIATNDKSKAQLQDKGFAIAALKNDLRKSAGNSVNTKFAKSSILGKPMSQSHRNQSVVRQPTAFKSERPRILKPRTPRNSRNDYCVTEILKEVNSRAKVPSNKTPKRNKPVEQISVHNEQVRQILTGHRFSIQKTYVVQKKTMSPRSCLRRKPTGKIFKTVGLRWVPTGKIFSSSTTKVDSEPLNGSNADITNQYECEQTLDVSADYDNPDPIPQRQDVSSSADAHVPSKRESYLLFGPLYDEFFNAGSNPQYKQPTTNIQPTSAPSTPTYVHAEENNDNQVEEEHLPDDEFTNPFCKLALEVAESSSHNIGLPTQESSLWIEASSKGVAKYALEILHKHSMDKGQIIGTPMATKPKLDADLSGNPVDQTDYRSKIGSLMYLTSSRPDIVQAGSSFDLTAFSDGDHAGCIDTRKSTSGEIQFLGDKLVSWMSKKQNCTAMSSTEAEYVALSTSCAQVITEYQLADMFTKALLEDRFKYLVRQIVLRYDGDECDKGRMPTKIELTLEQSQQGVSNDILKYPLTHFTMEQMLNNVRLEVKEASEMSLELLSITAIGSRLMLLGKDDSAAEVTEEITLNFRFRINSKSLNKVSILVVLNLSKVANPIYSLRDKDLLKSKDLQVVVAAAKLPIFNPNEFDLWKMRIEQYFLMTDYSLWEVILNGDSPISTRIVDGVVQVIAPTTAEQRLAKRNKLKATRTLLMDLPNRHHLKFNNHKDAKSLMEAIEKRFGGNKETKKVQKTLLKQQYENFSGTSSESLDQKHDWLQKLICQLEILGETISQEDINMKFLRSLPLEWKTHTLIWRNKADLEEQSLDDLFNNLKVYEAEVKGSSTFSRNTQNITFVSSNHTDSTNESVSVVPSVSAASSKALVSTLPNVNSLSDAVIYSFFASANGTTAIGFHMSKVNCYNCHTKGHLARECRSPRDNRNKDTPRRTVIVEASTSNALVSQCSSSSSGSDNETFSKNLSKLLESHVSEKNGLGYDSQVFDYDKLHSHESDDSVPTSPVNDRYKSGEGYHVVPRPYTRTFMPHKPDLVFNDAPTTRESIAPMVNVESSSNKPSKDMSKTLRSDAPIIEDWISDSEDETKIESVPKQKEPTVKSPRPVKHVVNNAHLPIRRPINHIPVTKNSNFNKKVTTVEVHKVNAIQGTKGNAKKASANWVWKSKCTILDHVSRLTSASMTIKQFDYNDALGRSKSVMAWWLLKTQTGNISYLSNFEEINGGYVTFGGNPKGGEITGKGKIKTGKLDFDDVYFVKELKFNFFCVLQMVLRENNMYNVDLKNVVPSGDLTCLFAKATLDESNLWHRRLGHINFKNMNKLVKGNLVRGLPSNIFENNYTLVACKKGKQHRASCKSKHGINLIIMHVSKKILDARKVGKETASAQQYVLLPLWSTSSQDPHNSDAAVTDAAFDVKENENKVYVSPSGSDKTKKHDDKAKRDDKCKNPSKYPDDPYMPELEEIVYSDDEEDVSARADLSNLETNISVSPIPTTRVHKDYPVNQIIARIEAIQLFLAYASFMGFMVYQMDVKSAFLYRTIKEEVYVCQPLGFEDPDYSDKVYVDDIIFGSINKKLCKAFEKLMKDKFQMSYLRELTFFLGLQVKQKVDWIFVNQDKYVAEILIKFSFTDVKSASTPIEIEKPLLKDPDGNDVDVHIYSTPRTQYSAAGQFGGVTDTILNTLDPLGKFNGKADEGFLIGYSVNSKAFKSLNYQLVLAGNQPNHSAGIKENLDADADIAFDVKDNENKVHVSPSSSDKPKNHDEKAKKEEFFVNSTNRVNAAIAPVTAVRPSPTNSTNSFNAASPSDNDVSPNFEIGGKSLFVDPSQYPDDPDMLRLEDIFYSDDEEDVGVEAYFSNLETNLSTRSMARMVKQQDLPKGKRAMGSKWVFRNKKDEKGSVTRNKARLIAQGSTQEEGIDYEEVFAPVARIEAIRLFLAYASFMSFMVYQMNVKSAFLCGTIEEEVYVCQPTGFEDPNYPDKVYKVVKAIYGLHQAPRACIRHWPTISWRMVFKEERLIRPCL